jgi:RimJ/RimL family protein N-acetyltransferase
VADPLETTRLRLVAATADDAPLLVELDADPEVMRYLTGGRPTTLAEARARLRAPGSTRWLAGRRDGGDVVGWFSLRADGDASHSHELGYRLGRRWWGQGLASEGTAAIIDHAFERLGSSRVWGQTMTVNHASRRVMERCGLRLVESFFADWGEVIEGSELGDVRYELRRPDWRRPGRPGGPSG